MFGELNSIVGKPCSMFEGTHFIPVLQVFMLRELGSMLGGPSPFPVQWIIMWRIRLFAWKGKINT